MKARWMTWIVALALLGIAAPIRAQAPSIDACLSSSLAEARLGRCSLDRCDSESFRADLLDLIGLEPGRQVSLADLERVSARVDALDVFQSHAVRCERLPAGGALLIVDLEGKAVVDDVRIDGIRYLYESDILKRTYIKPGQYLDDVSPAADLFDSQRRSIESLYEREGLEGTEVRVIPRQVGEQRVQVDIQVQPGMRRLVQAVDVLAQLPPEDAGCPIYGEATLRERFALKGGDAYTPKALRQARRALVSWLWARGIVAPRVEASVDEESGQVSLRVRYGQCARVQFWRRTGDPERPYRPEDPGDYRDVVTFGESGAFDWEEAEVGRAALVEHERARGYLDAQVIMTHREQPPAPAPGVLGQIDYFIDRGPRPRIGAIEFAGNRHLSDDQLRDLMETRPFSYFSQGGYLQVDLLMADLAQIADRYAADGYYLFRFEGDAEEGEASPRVERRSQRRVEGALEITRYSERGLSFEVLRRVTGGDLTVRVSVQEGPASRLAHVDITGTTRFSGSRILAALDVAPGQPWSGRQLRLIQDRLKRFYHSRGYSMMRFEAVCRADEPFIEPGSCDPERMRAERIVLELRVAEGEPARIGKIFVFGNRETADGFIRDRLPREGEPYDVTRLNRGVAELRNSGVFTSVHVRAIGLHERPARKRADLAVFVEEGRYESVEFALGFETINRPEESAPTLVTSFLQNSVSQADAGLLGHDEGVLSSLPDLLITSEVAYVDRNFLGRARQLQLPLKYGLSMTAPLRYAAFTPTYSDPFFSAARLIFQVRPFIIYDRATEAFDKFLFGMSAGVSRTFWKHLFVSVGYEISEISLRAPTYDIDDWTELALQNKVSLKTSLNLLDNPINPRSGAFVGASTSYLNAFQYGEFNNFIKWDLQAKGFVPVRSWFVIASMARYADSRSFGGEALPTYERYRLGGSKGLRGFDDDALVQYDADGSVNVTEKESLGDDGAVVHSYSLPFGGDVLIHGSEEIRFPIWPAMGLWGAGFFDWGGLAEQLADLHARSFRMSAGVGVRWLLGGQIPFRLDYGLKLDRRCRAIDEDTGACQALEDRGTLHFGLLYTF